LLAIYPLSVDEVYGYLLPRSGSRAVAEDLTSETFMAALESVRARPVADLSVAWLIGIARHKLADHWRRVERDERRLRAVAGNLGEELDPWDVTLDAIRAREVLDSLGAHHRSALTFRYLDGLPVREVAGLLERTEHATEALLTRARAAFRQMYGDDVRSRRP